MLECYLLSARPCLGEQSEREELWILTNTDRRGNLSIQTFPVTG